MEHVIHHWLWYVMLLTLCILLVSDVDGEANDIVLDTLSRKHEKIVRKRVNTLRSTLRKRQRNGERKEHGRVDVRNLFNRVSEAVSLILFAFQ